MNCPRCGSSRTINFITDVEDEQHYGCPDCDCWFTTHTETFTSLVKELEYEGTL